MFNRHHEEKVNVYQHILISTDGSDLAQKGVEQGLELAKALSSKVTLITVAEPYPLQSAATIDSWSTAQKEHADESLALAEASAKRIGVPVTFRIPTDESPAEAIVDAVKSLGCDLVVMASHGRRGVSRLLLGSQTAEVVSLSPVPVLVVR